MGTTHRDHADLLNKWTDWLTDDGPISGTVGRLEVDRDRWSVLRTAVAANASIPHLDDTLGWFWHHYACDAAIRLRRLGDQHSRSASIGRLLSELADNAELMTRTAYVDRWRSAVDGELWVEVHERCANDWFDDFAGNAGRTLSEALVRSDIKRLKDDLAPVRFYVDKRLAHHNPAEDPSLTYGQISRGIDTVSALYRKYVRLVRQVELPRHPAIDNTHWGEAFTATWCPDGLSATPRENAPGHGGRVLPDGDSTGSDGRRKRGQA